MISRQVGWISRPRRACHHSAFAMNSMKSRKARKTKALRRAGTQALGRSSPYVSPFVAQDVRAFPWTPNDNSLRPLSCESAPVSARAPRARRARARRLGHAAAPRPHHAAAARGRPRAGPARTSTGRRRRSRRAPRARRAGRARASRTRTPTPARTSAARPRRTRIARTSARRARAWRAEFGPALEPVADVGAKPGLAAAAARSAQTYACAFDTRAPRVALGAAARDANPALGPGAPTRARGRARRRRAGRRRVAAVRVAHRAPNAAYPRRRARPRPRAPRDATRARSSRSPRARAEPGRGRRGLAARAAPTSPTPAPRAHPGLKKGPVVLQTLSPVRIEQRASPEAARAPRRARRARAAAAAAAAAARARTATRRARARSRGRPRRPSARRRRAGAARSTTTSRGRGYVGPGSYDPDANSRLGNALGRPRVAVVRVSARGALPDARPHRPAPRAGRSTSRARARSSSACCPPIGGSGDLLRLCACHGKGAFGIWGPGARPPSPPRSRVVHVEHGELIGAAAARRARRRRRRSARRAPRRWRPASSSAGPCARRAGAAGRRPASSTRAARPSAPSRVASCSVDACVARVSSSSSASCVMTARSARRPRSSSRLGRRGGRRRRARAVAVAVGEPGERAPCRVAARSSSPRPAP